MTFANWRDERSIAVSNVNVVVLCDCPEYKIGRGI